MARYGNLIFENNFDKFDIYTTDIKSIKYVAEKILCWQASAILITLTKDKELAIDVNRDYVINSIDALMILQFASGIITNFI